MKSFLTVSSSCLRAIFLMGTMVSGIAHAQTKSNYNLRHVSVELMNGEVVKGKLVATVGNAMVLSDDRIKLEPGCQVTFRLWGVPLEYQGKVEAVTDSTLTVRLARKSEANLVSRKSIESLTITSRPKRTGVLATVTINSSAIRNIWLYKKGAGTAGFILGGLAGCMLGAALYSGIQKPEQGSLSEMGNFVLGGVVVGGIIGINMAKGGKHQINGDQQEFNSLMKRIYR